LEEVKQPGDAGLRLGTPAGRRALRMARDSSRAGEETRQIAPCVEHTLNATMPTEADTAAMLLTAEPIPWAGYLRAKRA
jgi:hypothetical protein